MKIIVIVPENRDAFLALRRAPYKNDEKNGVLHFPETFVFPLDFERRIFRLLERGYEEVTIRTASEIVLNWVRTWVRENQDKKPVAEVHYWRGEEDLKDHYSWSTRVIKWEEGDIVEIDSDGRMEDWRPCLRVYVESIRRIL